MSTWRFVLVLVIFLTTGSFSYAQTPSCGSIIIPAGFYDPDFEEDRIPIVDCGNPFGSTGIIADFLLQGSAVNNGQIITTTDAGVSDYGYVGENYFYNGLSLYRHEGENYVAVNVDFEAPTEDQVLNVLVEYFGGNQAQAAFYKNLYYATDAERYQQFFNNGNSFDPIIDGQAGDYVYYVFEQAEAYVKDNVVSERAVLLPGTYTVVRSFNDSPPVESRIQMEKWLTWLLPTAHAAEIVQTVTFTLQVPPPEPAGASSVLFLPGIMGSRLYEESGECSFSGDVEVRERWLEMSNCDLLRLETNFLGESINNIFTFADERGRLDRPLLPDVYDSFIDAMETWQDDAIIDDFRVVPYDWRMSVDAVVNTEYDPVTQRLTESGVDSYQDGYIYKALTELAATSLSGKVTIVTHSNGGLIAKGILRKMIDNNDPLLPKIDRLIMVAAPQVGTPEAVLGLLHGVDLGFPGNGDAFLDKETSRLLQNKMAFSHHLLPNANYFNRTNAAVITFDDGPLTTPWKQQYGQIRDRATLHAFLDDESGRPKPEPSDLLQPEIVDAALLTYARNMEALLDWEPPDSLKVIQVAGTGLDTTAGLTYFTDKECVKHNFGLSFLGCDEYQPKIGYRVNSVIDGDKTVVVPSALYMPSGQAEQWWVDLPSYNTSGVFGSTRNRKHSNIFEVDEIVDFIKDRLEEGVGEYDYIANFPPQLDSGSRLTFQLHSPLDLSVTTEKGEVSSTTNEVPNAVYRQIGEVQYISLPADTPNVRMRLRGYATGSFTLDIERREGDEVSERQTFSGVPSATSTMVTAAIAADLPPIQLAVDVDGNGTVDMRYDETGVVAEVVTYAQVRAYVQNLSLKNPEKKLLLAALNVAEKQYKNRDRSRVARLLERAALRAAEELVRLYGKKNLLSVPVENELAVMLKDLIEQTK